MCLANIVVNEIQAIPDIVSFAASAAAATASRPAADRVLAGDPEYRVRNYFRDATGRMLAGVWESTPGRWRVKYTENEFCHITAGEVRIESDGGGRWAFGAGDSFVIPAGFSGVWEVAKPLRKLYVLFGSASS